MRTHYRNIKNKKDKKLLAEKSMLISENYYQIHTKNNIKKNVKILSDKKMNMDLSKLKYDEDCGE